MATTKKFLDLEGLRYFAQKLGLVKVVSSLPTSATNSDTLYITNCVGSADKPFLNNTYISNDSTPLYLIFGQDDNVILGSNGEYFQYTYTYSNNIIKINTYDFTYDKTNNRISVNGKIFTWYDSSKNIVAYWYEKYGAYIEINNNGKKEYKNIFDFYTRTEIDNILDGVIREVKLDSTATAVTKSGNTVTIPTVAGKKGDNGTNGRDGGIWYNGTGVTGTSTTATIFSGSGVASAIVGDMFLNTSNSNVYKCTTAGSASAAKWTYVCNIKGATGKSGILKAEAYSSENEIKFPVDDITFGEFSDFRSVISSIYESDKQSLTLYYTYPTPHGNIRTISADNAISSATKIHWFPNVESINSGGITGVSGTTYNDKIRREYIVIEFNETNGDSYYTISMPNSNDDVNLLKRFFGIQQYMIIHNTSNIELNIQFDLNTYDFPGVFIANNTSGLFTLQPNEMYEFCAILLPNAKHGMFEIPYYKYHITWTNYGEVTF